MKKEYANKLEGIRRRHYLRKIGEVARQDEEGGWITTENGHHVHINGEGVPDRGNPHVITAMQGGKSGSESTGKSYKWGEKQSPYTGADHSIQGYYKNGERAAYLESSDNDGDYGYTAYLDDKTPIGTYKNKEIAQKAIEKNWETVKNGITNTYAKEKGWKVSSEGYYEASPDKVSSDDLKKMTPKTKVSINSSLADPGEEYTKMKSGKFKSQSKGSSASRTVSAKEMADMVKNSKSETRIQLPMEVSKKR